MATRVQNVQNGPKNDYFWLSAPAKGAGSGRGLRPPALGLHDERGVAIGVAAGRHTPPPTREPSGTLHSTGDVPVFVKAVFGACGAAGFCVYFLFGKCDARGAAPGTAQAQARGIGGQQPR